MSDRSEQRITRRQLLLGLGALGVSSAVCACGGITATALLLGRERLPDAEIVILEQATPLPTLAPPRIAPREAWGALPPNHDAPNEKGFYSADNPEGWRIYEDELATHYQTVVVHHSALYINSDLETLADIQTLHRDQRGWADVAYHFLVGKDGTIYAGRDWAVRGTHVGGYNTGSLGVCLLGNFMVEAPSQVQLSSTQYLIRWAAQRLQLTHIAGHRDFFSQTQCPGDYLVTHIESFATSAHLQIGTEGYIAPQFLYESQSPCCCCTHN